MAVGILTVVVLARWLTPDPRGLGTHEQLGLPPCLTSSVFGIPCPFCGMTTSFSLMAHGEVSASFATQPAGALGFILSIIAFLLCIAFGVTGRAVPLGANFWRARWLVLLGMSVVLCAWIYKLLDHLHLIGIFGIDL